MSPPFPLKDHGSPALAAPCGRYTTAFVFAPLPLSARLAVAGGDALPTGSRGPFQPEPTTSQVPGHVPGHLPVHLESSNMQVMILFPSLRSPQDRVPYRKAGSRSRPRVPHLSPLPNRLPGTHHQDSDDVH